MGLVWFITVTVLLIAAYMLTIIVVGILAFHMFLFLSSREKNVQPTGNLSDYSERLKVDNIEVLRKLSQFFAIENMHSKHTRYLDFALEHPD
jgi:hypothetical protein